MSLLTFVPLTGSIGVIAPRVTVESFGPQRTIAADE